MNYIARVLHLFSSSFYFFAIARRSVTSNLFTTYIFNTVVVDVDIYIFDVVVVGGGIEYAHLYVEGFKFSEFHTAVVIHSFVVAYICEVSFLSTF